MASSADPFEPPEIKPNYLSAESDLEVMLSGVKQGRAIFAAPAMAAYTTGETRPGVPLETVNDMRKYAQENGTTVYHPVGTCKMGSDELAVVDDELRVRGIDGLRVADASIMPTLIGGNTHAPAVMIAEKCADFVLATGRDRSAEPVGAQAVAG